MRRICKSWLTTLTLVISVAPSAEAGTSAPSCQPLGHDKPALLELRGEGFAIEDPDRRQTFAYELIPCLGSPDPTLRDQVAYEGLATLLRGKQLDTDAISHLRSSLTDELAKIDPDDEGFRRPFAALALAEVARADRIEPIFSDDERADLVAAATGYMRSIEDYRGFEEGEGWRHGVAHAADLLMQLALNPAVDRAQLIDIRDAVASQIAPTGHFYIYGESERLARPILFIAMRDEFSATEWADWFARIASPKPFARWPEAFSTQVGLAKLHNTKAFAQTIYVNATASDNQALTVLRQPVLEILQQLP